jgi:hypothetical protein
MAKVRTGFVTNSSSSSFIVAFDEMPSSINELQGLLFDEGQINVEVYDRSISCTEAAGIVFNDMQNQKPNDMKEIMSALEGYFEDAPDYNDYTKDYDFKSKEYKEAMARYEEDSKAFIMAKIKRFKKDNRNRDIYVFSYADDGGQVVMEHGDIFSHLPHIRISHH